MTLSRRQYAGHQARAAGRRLEALVQHSLRVYAPGAFTHHPQPAQTRQGNYTAPTIGDFVVLYRTDAGQLSMLIECKSTKNTSWSLSMVSRQQAARLTSWDANGGISLLIIAHTPGARATSYAVPWRAVEPAWSRWSREGGRPASLSWDALDELAVSRCTAGHSWNFISPLMLLERTGGLL